MFEIYQKIHYHQQLVTQHSHCFQLPLDYTWQIVRDRVQQFGPVDLTEMIAPGCAKVTFTVAADAERARKSLQNTTVEGRVIGVEFLA